MEGLERKRSYHEKSLFESKLCKTNSDHHFSFLSQLYDIFKTKDLFEIDNLTFLFPKELFKDNF